MAEAGLLLASAHAELAKQLARVPKDRRGAAVAVMDPAGEWAVSAATRVGEDWQVGVEVSGVLRDRKATRARVIVAGTW